MNLPGFGTHIQSRAFTLTNFKGEGEEEGEGGKDVRREGCRVGGRGTKSETA